MAPRRGLYAPGQTPDQRVQQRLGDLEALRSPLEGGVGSWVHSQGMMWAGSTGWANNVTYWNRLWFPGPARVSGLGLYTSTGVVGAGAVSALYDASGARIANRAVFTAVNTTANLATGISFDTPVDIPGGVYYGGFGFSSTSLGVYFQYGCVGGSTAGPGAGATATAITPPAAGSGMPTANVPMMVAY